MGIGKKSVVIASFSIAFTMSAQYAQAAVLSLDFNSGSSNSSGGDLVFRETNGFQVTFTDDNSNGYYGGNADGVHITNRNYGNIKVGHPTDFVLGTFNSFSGSNNVHSSGIVALFNQGVESVSFLDTDNDWTPKSLFAFDELGTLIYQSQPGTQKTFFVDNSMTMGNALIHSIEFDTKAGILGGSSDYTVFTIDNFEVEYKSSVPEPTSVVGLIALGTLSFGSRLLKRISRE